MKIINHESYVSFEVAKLLKEAGFKWFINTSYRDDVLMRQGNLLCDNFNGKQYENTARHEFFSAPTLDVAQRWLREIKNVVLLVDFNNDEDCEENERYGVTVYNAKKRIIDLATYPTYEEAQEAGIKKALEIILEKGE